MIPYGKQSLDEKDVEAVVRVLRSNFITQGPRLAEFEKLLAKATGAKYAAAVSSGTAALHLAYLACGLRPGDEVIVPANTFAATANMLVVIGAKPVFCDIRLDTYNIDETQIEKLINQKTKAIVPVHFAGQAADMDKIWQIAKKHKLKVIEDAAHALGGRYKGKKIGYGRSNMVIFSFHPVKSITTGEGGAILTNSKAYYKRLLLLRNHGIAKDKNGFNIMLELGFNYRMTDIQAALGKSQLKKLDSFIRKRRQIAKQYYKNLKNCDDIILPTPHSHPLPFKGRGKKGEGAWHLFVIRLKNPKHRLSLIRYLKKRGIGTQVHYPPVYSHPYYRKLGLRANCPNAESYAKTCLSIPIYPDLSLREVNFICKNIKNYFSR